MTVLDYASYKDVPKSAWRWKNFSPAEIACRGTGKLKINTEAMDKLQALRTKLGKPLIVRSAYRSPEHNKAVGGAKASKHMLGEAFDISMANHDPEVFEAAARVVRARKGLVARHVRNPQGPVRGPDAPGQSFSAGEAEPAAGGPPGADPERDDGVAARPLGGRRHPARRRRLARRDHRSGAAATGRRQTPGRARGRA